jgi:hypothetical protein
MKKHNIGCLYMYGIGILVVSFVYCSMSSGSDKSENIQKNKPNRTYTSGYQSI